jgi:hypothetical protein
MNKQSVLDQHDKIICKLQQECVFIQQLELGRLYLIQEDGAKSYGILKAFNKESARFLIVASSNTYYGQKDYKNRRRNVNAFNYSDDVYGNYPGLQGNIYRAKKSEVAMMMTMPFVAPELDTILQGKRKALMD